MATVFDAAAYILRTKGEMIAMKLQKLVYNSQAWSLVWDLSPMFDERIEAWANGPGVRELYKLHRGQFRISSIGAGDPDALTPTQRETIDAVLAYYGDRHPQWLSDLTHMEDPWNTARGDLPPGFPSDAAISHGALYEYYGGIAPNGVEGREAARQQSRRNGPRSG